MIERSASVNELTFLEQSTVIVNELNCVCVNRKVSCQLSRTCNSKCVVSICAYNISINGPVNEMIACLRLCLNGNAFAIVINAFSRN